LLEKIKNSWFGKIISSLIPIYRGYAKEKDRVLTDQLIKQKLQEILLFSKENLFKVVQFYYNQNEKDKSNSVNNICIELDLFRNRIKNSEFGFHPKNQSLLKERKEDYDNIIKADASMIYYADEILKISSHLYSKVLNNEDINIDILDLFKNLEKLEEIFQKRKDFITGISQVLEIKDPNNSK